MNNGQNENTGVELDPTEPRRYVIEVGATEINFAEMHYVSQPVHSGVGGEQVMLDFIEILGVVLDQCGLPMCATLLGKLATFAGQEAMVIAQAKAEMN